MKALLKLTVRKNADFSFEESRIAMNRMNKPPERQDTVSPLR